MVATHPLFLRSRSADLAAEHSSSFSFRCAFSNWGGRSSPHSSSRARDFSARSSTSFYSKSHGCFELNWCHQETHFASRPFFMVACNASTGCSLRTTQYPTAWPNSFSRGQTSNQDTHTAEYFSRSHVTAVPTIAGRLLYPLHRRRRRARDSFFYPHLTMHDVFSS